MPCGSRGPTVIGWAHGSKVFLKALAGPRYPEPPLAGERIQAWEDAVRQVPDDPDLWINLGDAYFHDGAMAGVEEPLPRGARRSTARSRWTRRSTSSPCSTCCRSRAWSGIPPRCGA